MVRRILLVLLTLVTVVPMEAQYQNDNVRKKWSREEKKAAIIKRNEQKGRKTTIIDLLDEEQTIGFTYNYGKYFPYGGSFNYSYGVFMGSLDFGINNDKDVFVKVKESDGYRKTNKLDPKFFLTLTPQFYLRYFSVGCGFGALFMDNDETEEKWSSSNSSSQSDSGFGTTSSSSKSTISSTGMNKLKFMIRPTVKGFIPLSDELYVTASVGYDYIFGLKDIDKSGFNFGLGLQWSIDY